MPNKTFEYNGQPITKAWISEVVQGEKAQRDKIQVAILGCIAQGISASYSFDLLTQLVSGMKQHGGRNLKGIYTYITKTCQGLHWNEKESRFVAVKDKSKVIFEPLAYDWYKEGKIAADNKVELYDLNASIKSLISKLSKVASGEAKDKTLQPVQAKEMLDKLQPQPQQA